MWSAVWFVLLFAMTAKGQTSTKTKDDWVDPMDPTGSFFNDQRGEDWIDPFDMGLPPVHVQQPVKNKSPPRLPANTRPSPPKEMSAPIKDGNKQKAEKPQPMEEKCSNVSSHNQVSEVVFLRRFANVLVKSLSLHDSPAAGMDTNVKVQMSAADVRAVLEFAAGGRHPADFDAVTSNMMAYTFPDKRESLFKLPAVDEDAAMRAAAAACLVYWCYMYSQGQYWRLTTSAFFVSVAWTWCHMYKKAISDKMTRLAKTLMDMPKECSPDSMTWSESLAAAFSSSDKCREYHDAILINPLVEVAPTMAVAQTLTTFVLLPLEHVGLALGKFFSALTSELTWFNSPFVLLFVFVTILLVTMMSFKYKIDLPFWIGSFGPSAPAAATAAAEIQQLRAKCKALEAQHLAALNTRADTVQDIKSIECDKTAAEEEVATVIGDMRARRHLPSSIKVDNTQQVQLGSTELSDQLPSPSQHVILEKPSEIESVHDSGDGCADGGSHVICAAEVAGTVDEFAKAATDKTAEEEVARVFGDMRAQRHLPSSIKVANAQQVQLGSTEMSGQLPSPLQFLNLEKLSEILSRAEDEFGSEVVTDQTAEDEVVRIFSGLRAQKHLTSSEDVHSVEETHLESAERSEDLSSSIQVFDADELIDTVADCADNGSSAVDAKVKTNTNACLAAVNESSQPKGRPKSASEMSAGDGIDDEEFNRRLAAAEVEAMMESSYEILPTPPEP